jgi:hypothetical protein
MIMSKNDASNTENDENSKMFEYGAASNTDVTSLQTHISCDTGVEPSETYIHSWVNWKDPEIDPNAAIIQIQQVLEGMILKGIR